MSVEEYLAADQIAERPLEYHDGEVFPLAEATLAHGRIALKVGRALDQRLDGTPCFASGPARVRVSSSQYLYPDVLVVCGQPVITSVPDSSLTNPKVIFEILSPSTANYDFGAKFHIYRQLSSFEEYVLIAQDQPRVDVLRRLPDGRWILTINEGLDAVMDLESIQVKIPIREIYAGILPL